MLELLIIITLLGILIGLGIPSYLKYVRQARLYDAQRAMLSNAKFLEQAYSRKFSFKQNSTTWIKFPESLRQTDHFCIKMQGNPRGVKGDRYTMKAVAMDKLAEPRSLILNEDHQLLICENSTSTCLEKNYFAGNFHRTDKNCRFL